MELLFIVLGGAILGMAARYALPLRHTHGVLLIPCAGAALAAVLWVGLTWLGWPWDRGWIWTVTLVATAIIIGVVDLALGLVRTRADEHRQVLFSKGATAH